MTQFRNYITPDRAKLVDMSPPTLRTSYIFVVKAQADTLGTLLLAKNTFPLAAPIQIFALLLMFTLSIIYAHVLWAFERRDNVSIDAAYGSGVFDAWWLGLVSSVRDVYCVCMCVCVCVYVCTHLC